MTEAGLRQGRPHCLAETPMNPAARRPVSSFFLVLISCCLADSRKSNSGYDSAMGVAPRVDIARSRASKTRVSLWRECLPCHAAASWFSSA